MNRPPIVELRRLRDVARRRAKTPPPSSDVSARKTGAQTRNRSGFVVGRRPLPSSFHKLVAADDRIVVDTYPVDARGKFGVSRHHWPYRTALAVSDEVRPPKSKYSKFVKPMFAKGASAQLIGRQTAITAAHVVSDGRDWYDFRSFIGGMVTKMTSGLTSPPGKSGLEIEQKFLAGPFNCYIPHIPQGYRDLPSFREFDYAVIDFRDDDSACSDEPGSVLGFAAPLIWGVDASINYESRPVVVTGYDRFSDGPLASSYLPYRAPTPLTRIGGPGTIAPSSEDPRILLHTLDTENGASGAGILQPWFRESDYRCVGIHLGPHGSDPVNEARRFDYEVYTFLVSTSSEY